MKNLDAEYVRSILDYNPETGEFRWKVRPREHFSTVRACRTWNAKHGCSVAGCISTSGYLLISINNRLYRAHRLAVLIITGEWPLIEVDHRDNDQGNNRWGNLREASSSQNKWNTRKRSDNSSGNKGVYWHSRYKKWHVQIKKNGKHYHIGYFHEDKIEDAAAAYARAAKELHDEFARAA